MHNGTKCVCDATIDADRTSSYHTQIPMRELPHTDISPKRIIAKPNVLGME